MRSMVLEFPNRNPYSYILHFDLELRRASQIECSSILKTGFSALSSESAVMLRLLSSAWRRWSVWVQCLLRVPFPRCCMVSLLSLPCISGTQSGLPCVLTSRQSAGGPFLEVFLCRAPSHMNSGPKFSRSALPWTLISLWDRGQLLDVSQQPSVLKAASYHTTGNCRACLTPLLSLQSGITVLYYLCLFTWKQ